MSAPTFRDAVAAEITSASGSGRTVQSPDLAAAYVLAMPEMQAVKSALQVLDNAGGPNYLTVGLDLPESVVAWVLA